MSLTVYERNRLLKKTLGIGYVTIIAAKAAKSVGRTSEVLRCEETGQRTPDDSIETIAAEALGLTVAETFPSRETVGAPNTLPNGVRSDVPESGDSGVSSAAEGEEMPGADA